MARSQDGWHSHGGRDAERLQDRGWESSRVRRAAHELDSEDYPTRTAANVQAADATLWFGRTDSKGAAATFSAAHGSRKPTKIISVGGFPTRPSEVLAWLRENNVKVLNVAGHRESKAPGIGQRVETFLARVFGITQRQQTPRG